MSSTGDARRSGAGRDLLMIFFVAVPVLVGLVLAFALGQFTARAPVGVMQAGVNEGPPESAPDPGVLLAENERADEIRDLQKQLAALKKEVAELKSDKKGLESKLSVAADTVNKLTHSLQEEKRRAEEAEWRAGQATGAGEGTIRP